jgi:hypothetical protein
LQVNNELDIQKKKKILSSENKIKTLERVIYTVKVKQKNPLATKKKNV